MRGQHTRSLGAPSKSVGDFLAAVSSFSKPVKAYPTCTVDNADGGVFSGEPNAAKAIGSKSCDGGLAAQVGENYAIFFGERPVAGLFVVANFYNAMTFGNNDSVVFIQEAIDST